jgi:hypothetical protein
MSPIILRIVREAKTRGMITDLCFIKIVYYYESTLHRIRSSVPGARPVKGRTAVLPLRVSIQLEDSHLF